MASTAPTASEGGTTVTPGEARSRQKDGEDVHGLPVTASTSRERIRGEYVTDLDDLDVGDDVFVAYRERRDGGGLSYTPNGVNLVGRVVRREGSAVIVAPDFAGDEEVAITPAGALQSNPTLQRVGGHYGIKHLIRRADTDATRRRNVAFWNAVADRGIDVEFDTMVGGETLVVRPETPDEYRFTLGLVNHVRSEHGVDVDVEATWYETEDDLVGETGWKGKEAVPDHDTVRIGVDC